MENDVSKAGEFCRNFWEAHQTEILHFGKVLVLSVLIVLIAWLITRIVRSMIQKMVQRIPALDESAAKVIAGVSRVIIWILASLIILELFGINTASILTLLGAIGLAVGLAVKDSLSNIAAGLMLFFLRPYKAGDYVDCGSISGTIKEMGLFSTVLMTVDGLFISAPNSVIFGNPIKNYSRNPLRRADITVGIAYGDSLPQALTVLREFLLKNDLIEKDPAPDVLVADLADSSVNLTLRFWVKTADYWTAYWMVRKELKNTIESAGLNIPFPQRVVTFATPLELNKPE
ncbi:MAG: mechanosensitive ion channel family protein [Lentisphaeria bacterium]|nr:mechanosensitive ion channel family protein [Lentisphaeria bacterium]